jgi:putative flippase GtrA
VRPDRTLHGQLARFALVGATNTAATLAAFAVLHAAGLAVSVASVAAFGLGALNGYRLNRAWTFRSGPATAAGLARYAVVQGAAALAQARLVVLLDAALGGRALLAQGLALVPVSLAAFALSRSWAFRSPPEPPARRDPLARPAGTG